MILKFLDNKMRRAFSDAALQYDVLTSLHKEIGRELLRKTIAFGDTMAKSTDTGQILDVGMGTGWLTSRLKTYFPDAQVIGLDFAAGMIDVAKAREDGFHIVQADARHLPFRHDSFEMIASNLAYQWMPDLPVALGGCHEILKKEGKIFLTMFGHDTFEELFASLSKTQGNKGKLTLARLASGSQVLAALKKCGFRDIVVQQERIKVHFADMLALVKWIKDIGANALMSNVFVGRDWLVKANEYYTETFRDRWGVYATFDVIWVEARK